MLDVASGALPNPAERPASSREMGEPVGMSEAPENRSESVDVPPSGYRTAPLAIEGMPPGISYIIGNEAAERFSFYGMKAILVVFMTKYLTDSSGELTVMSESDASAAVHLFTSAVYFTPLLGALLSEIVLGKYRTIIGLSVVYCLGHLTLAIDNTQFGMAMGLGLIAAGSGGIKPCVSAHVGDQFGAPNAHLLERAFSWFYIAINVGAAVSMILTPWLLAHVGPHVAFGVPGALMLIATVVFWLGRDRFAHVPPGGKAFLREALSPEGLRALGRLSILYVFVAMFWALFDQTGTRWVLQAEHMDRHFLGIEWLPSQMQAVNPVLIVLLVPIFSFGVYPALRRFFPVTPLRKISLGFFITVGAFLIAAQLQVWIDAGQTPSIGWQFLGYVVLTSAEVLVSITCLEFSYTQAPRNMKSLVMAAFLMSVSIGNLFTAGVNLAMNRPDVASALQGANYYLFFAGLMFATALLFVPVARRFKEREHLQPTNS